jgi:hypothetical protein
MKINCNFWYLNCTCFSKLPDHLIFVTDEAQNISLSLLKKLQQYALTKERIYKYLKVKYPVQELEIILSAINRSDPPENCQTQLQEWANSSSTTSTFNAQLGREAEGTGLNDGVDNGHAEGRNL